MDPSILAPEIQLIEDRTSREDIPVYLSHEIFYLGEFPLFSNPLNETQLYRFAIDVLCKIQNISLYGMRPFLKCRIVTHTAHAQPSAPLKFENGCIDTILRKKLGSGRQIGCWETNLSATAVTPNNRAGNEVVAAEHRLNLIHTTLLYQLPDSRTAYSFSLNENGLNDTDTKTQLTTPTNQILRVPMTSTAEP
jgi:hypothetical protein